MWHYIYTHTHTHTMPLQIFLRIRSALSLSRHSKCNEFGLKPAVMRDGGRRIRFGNAVSGHLKGKSDSHSIQILPIHLNHKLKVCYSEVLHNKLLFISKHIERIQFGM